MSHRSELGNQIGGFKRGTSILVFGDLGFLPVYFLSWEVRNAVPDALLIRHDEGDRHLQQDEIGRLCRYAKEKNTIGLLFYDFGESFPGEALNLTTVRKLVKEESRFDVVLLVKKRWPPCEVEVAKARGGTFGIVLIRPTTY